MDWRAFFPPGTAVMALPNWRAPKLLIPMSTPSRQWKSALFYPAYRPLAKMFRLWLRGRAAWGIGETRICDADRWELNDFLGDRFGGPVLPTVAIGTCKFAGKVVARLANATGNVVGYLKCAGSAAADHRIVHESSILTILPEGAGPRTLAIGALAGRRAMLLRPVNGTPVSVWADPDQHAFAFLRRLESTARYSPDIHPGLEFLRNAKTAERPNAEQLINALASRRWPVTIRHGDFSPWNVLQQTRTDPTLVAVDWEFATIDGFPHMDLAHWLLQLSLLLRHQSPEAARRRAVEYMTAHTEISLSVDQAHAIVSATAYSVYQRAVLDGESPHGPTQQWQRGVWECHPARCQVFVAGDALPVLAESFDAVPRARPSTLPIAPPVPVLRARALH